MLVYTIIYQDERDLNYRGNCLPSNNSHYNLQMTGVMAEGLNKQWSEAKTEKLSTRETPAVANETEWRITE